MEYDKECAKEYSKKVSPRVKIFGGDQSNLEDLGQMIKENGVDLYDFIVDDGGHTMVQQITSLKFLLKYVKPGGYYFLEDMETSYIPDFGGAYLKNDTAIEYIKDLIDRFYIGDHELIGLIESIDCFNQICVFTRTK
jgi:cephalosporin hydroxylase